MDIFLEYGKAFLCGGIICLIGQLLIDKTPLTPARILVTYVAFVAAVVTALGTEIYRALK